MILHKNIAERIEWLAGQALDQTESMHIVTNYPSRSDTDEKMLRTYLCYPANLRGNPVSSFQDNKLGLCLYKEREAMREKRWSVVDFNAPRPDWNTVSANTAFTRSYLNDWTTSHTVMEDVIEDNQW